MGEDTGQNDRQTNRQTDTSTDNKGHLELSGACKPINIQLKCIQKLEAIQRWLAICDKNSFCAFLARVKTYTHTKN